MLQENLANAQQRCMYSGP